MKQLVQNHAATAAQLFFVAAAVFSSLGLPALFGIEAYGTFVATTATTFMIHRLTDLMIEPLIIEKSPRKLIAVASTSFAISLLLAAALNLFEAPYQVYIILLAALLASTTVLNLIFQSGDALAQLMYAVAFATGLVVIAAFFALMGTSNIVFLLILASGIGAVIGTACLIIRQPHVLSLDAGRPIFSGLLNGAFERFCFSAFSITLLFVTPLLAQHDITTHDLGQLRIFLSVAFLGYWLTPASPKHFYTKADGLSSLSGILRFLSSHKWPLFLLLAGWVVSLFVLRNVSSSLSDLRFAAAACLYPAGFCLSFFDKGILKQSGLQKTSYIVGLYSLMTAAMLYLCKHTYEFEIAVAIAITLFPTWLAIFLNRGLLAFTVLPVFTTLFGFAVISGLQWSLVFASGLALIFCLWIFVKKAETPA